MARPQRRAALGTQSPFDPLMDLKPPKCNSALQSYPHGTAKRQRGAVSGLGALGNVMVDLIFDLQLLEVDKMQLVGKLQPQAALCSRAAHIGRRSVLAGSCTALCGYSKWCGWTPLLSSARKAQASCTDSAGGCSAAAPSSATVASHRRRCRSLHLCVLHHDCAVLVASLRALMQPVHSTAMSTWSTALRHCAGTPTYEGTPV